MRQLRRKIVESLEAGFYKEILPSTPKTQAKAVLKKCIFEE
jgi:hypothetical protein